MHFDVEKPIIAETNNEKDGLLVYNVHRKEWRRYQNKTMIPKGDNIDCFRLIGLHIVNTD